MGFSHPRPSVSIIVPKGVFMKMIRCIVRPEKETDVVKNLEKSGFTALTKIDVLGRGKQKGIQVGSAKYDELAKTMYLLVVEDEEFPRAMDALKVGARTGNPGDGKIFVTEVDEAITIRTGEKVL
jgi:nitrogen regulatory protein PII 1